MTKSTSRSKRSLAQIIYGFGGPSPMLCALAGLMQAVESLHVRALGVKQ